MLRQGLEAEVFTAVKTKFPILCPKKESRTQGVQERVKRSLESSGGSGKAIERSLVWKPPGRGDRR